MRSNNTRLRLLLIQELLYKKTDEDHPATTVSIINYLETQGITVDRKTLGADIKILMERNPEIVIIKSSPNKYFWGDRTFEVPELKLLIDAVSSSRFITETQSKKLIKKIAGLASESQAENLKRHITATGRTKADNRKLYYMVDTITEAINLKRKITFSYTEYDENKTKILRNNGEIYTLSPYELYWNQDYYYVVGYSDKHENISAFRVDRLEKPMVTEEKAKRKPKDFKVRDYSDKIFQMFDGEDVVVELECENMLMKYVIDRFGIDVNTELKSDNTFIAKVNVMLSPTFYAWVFQFGGKMRIVAPDSAIDGYKVMLNL